jgi:hypothetical protein
MFEKFTETIEPFLIGAYRKITDPPPPNLRGDRYVEYAWIAGNMPAGPGKGLEFGCAHSHLSLIAIMRGFSMTAIDLAEVEWWYSSPQLTFLRKDLFLLNLEESTLDLIINCSTVEHAGLDRYGGQQRLDGDLEAMECLRRLLKPRARMLLTIPVGKDAVFPRWHRVYGEERLPRLLQGFSLEKENYWVKDERNRWIEADKDKAFMWPTQQTSYGLGCFSLLKNA